MILENQNWEEEIIKAECHWYLDGQIGFLLEFAENNLEKFVMYRDKFVKLWDSAKSEEKTMKALQDSAGFIRTQIARTLNLRITPQIIFEKDDSIEYGAKIDSILNELKKEKNK